MLVAGFSQCYLLSLRANHILTFLRTLILFASNTIFNRSDIAFMSYTSYAIYQTHSNEKQSSQLISLIACQIFFRLYCLN